MSRTGPRKTTNVQAEAPPTAAEPAAEAAPAAPAQGPPRLNTGWKIAIVVWVLGFGGLGAFELINFFWKLIAG
jgi:hypothetical protein